MFPCFVPLLFLVVLGFSLVSLSFSNVFLRFQSFSVAHMTLRTDKQHVFEGRFSMVSSLDNFNLKFGFGVDFYLHIGVTMSTF